MTDFMTRKEYFLLLDMLQLEILNNYEREDFHVAVVEQTVDSLPYFKDYMGVLLVADSAIIDQAMQQLEDNEFSYTDWYLFSKELAEEVLYIELRNRLDD